MINVFIDGMVVGNCMYSYVVCVIDFVLNLGVVLIVVLVMMFDVILLVVLLLLVICWVLCFRFMYGLFYLDFLYKLLYFVLLLVIVLDSSVVFVWFVVMDDVGVMGYEFSRDGVVIVIVGMIVYIDLVGVGIYGYFVVVFDVVGN